MSASSHSRRIAQRIVEAVDPRSAPALLREYARSAGAPEVALPDAGCVVLVGHRASGKTRLLPLVAELLGWPGVELYEEISRRAGRDLKTWVEEDPEGFRAEERAAFQAVPPRRVVAVGGGFLSLHPDLLSGHLAVLVPVSFETYRERLLADPGRPRLRPELPLEEEIRSVYEEREALHRKSDVVSLAAFLRAVVEDECAS
jgi:shikimate kinase